MKNDEYLMIHNKIDFLLTYSHSFSETTIKNLLLNEGIRIEDIEIVLNDMCIDWELYILIAVKNFLNIDGIVSVEKIRTKLNSNNYFNLNELEQYLISRQYSENDIEKVIICITEEEDKC